MKSYIVVSIISRSLQCIFLQICLIKIPVYNCDMFSCLSMKLYHDQYNAQLCDKCKTVLRVLYLNTYYLCFLVRKIDTQTFGTTSQIHIFSGALHDQTEDMHILLPLPYQMCWHKYDVNVASLYFYMVHICNFCLHKTFCFDYFGFDFWVSRILITPGQQQCNYTFSINLKLASTHYLVFC